MLFGAISGSVSGSADLDGDPSLSVAFLGEPLAVRMEQFLAGL